jgi:hypothetical protein
VDGIPGSGEEVYTQLGPTLSGSGRREIGMGPQMSMQLDSSFRVTFEDGTPVVPRLEILHSQVANVLDAFEAAFGF